MIPVAVQTLLLVAAGVALFRLWRIAAPSRGWLQLVVVAGFLSRALGGQLLFWISWARFPFARSLQLGDGFWVFAPDATFYFAEAVKAAEKGWDAILFFDRSAASPTYMQTLATAIWFFGGAVALGVLINLFSYLGVIAILRRWSVKVPEADRAAALAIVGFSLSPSLILWSLQPLKDSMFQFLFVAFVAVCAMWQYAWHAPRAWAMRIGSAALLMMLIFAIAGMRWYFAGALLLSLALFMAIVALRSLEPKLYALPAAAIVLLLLAQNLAVSAGPYLPPAIAAALAPPTALKSFTKTPAAVLASVDRARRGFDSTSAATVIKPGRRLDPNQPVQQAAITPPPLPATPPHVIPKPDAVMKTTASSPPVEPRPLPVTPAVVAPAPAHVVAAATPLPPIEPAAPPTPSPVLSASTPADTHEMHLPSDTDVKALVQMQTAAWNDDDVKLQASGFQPDFELIVGPLTIHGWQPVLGYLSNPDLRAQRGTLTLSNASIRADAPVIAGRWALSVGGQPTGVGDFRMSLRQERDGWKIARFEMGAPGALSALPAAVPLPVTASVSPESVKAVDSKAATDPIAQSGSKPMADTPAKPVATPIAEPIEKVIAKNVAKAVVIPARVPPRAQPAVAPPAATPAPSPKHIVNDDEAIRQLFVLLARGWNRNDPGALMDVYWHSPELQVNEGNVTTRGFDRRLAECVSLATSHDGLGLLAITDLHSIANGELANVTGHWSVTGNDGIVIRGFTATLRNFPDAGWKITSQKFDGLVAKQSRTTRLLSGAAALFLPRTLGQALGLFEIDGGRGMLWFAELDTLIFDAMLVIVCVALFFARRSRPWRNPLVWFVILTTVLVGVPIAYSINNFGTLFRLREMIYLGFLLTPLAIWEKRAPLS